MTTECFFAMFWFFHMKIRFFVLKSEGKKEWASHNPLRIFFHTAVRKYNFFLGGYDSPLEEKIIFPRGLWLTLGIFVFIYTFTFIRALEKALRAHASSSGGAACPGGTWGQPQGSTKRVGGWFQGDLSEKKNLWRTKYEGWTHRREGGNSGLD